MRDGTSFCVPIFRSCGWIGVLVKRLRNSLLSCVLHAIVSVEDNAFDLALIYENITIAESWRTVVILSDLLQLSVGECISALFLSSPCAHVLA